MVPPSKIFGRLGNSLFQYAYIYAQMREGLIPDIYIQDEKYFEKYKDEVIKLFSEGIVYKPYVSIHVRRGDYVGHSFYTNLMETDYYEKAMSQFPNEDFLVFSDDILWTQKQPIFKGCDFCYITDEVDALNEMAGCRHNIIANSSFSLWAGILNPNPNKKVIAPKENRYYTDGVTRTHFPKTFIQLDLSPLPTNARN